MRRIHLVWALLCAGCGGDQFGASAHGVEDAGSDGSPRTTVQPSQADAESSGGSAGAVALHHSSGGSSVGAGGSVSQGGSSGSSGAAGGGGTSSGGGGAQAGGAPSDGGTDACETGATRCSGTQPQVCASGAWFDSGSACSGDTPVCLEGRCVECSPGEERCMGPTQPGKCDSTGTMVASGSACSGTTPQCLDNTCVACDGSNVKTAGYCPDCGGLECCKTSTATPGAIGSCGCQTFNGCE
jgi:hypothetical protein